MHGAIVVVFAVCLAAIAVIAIVTLRAERATASRLESEIKLLAEVHHLAESTVRLCLEGLAFRSDTVHVPIVESCENLQTSFDAFMSLARTHVHEGELGDTTTMLPEFPPLIAAIRSDVIVFISHLKDSEFESAAQQYRERLTSRITRVANFTGDMGASLAHSRDESQWRTARNIIITVGLSTLASIMLIIVASLSAKRLARLQFALDQALENAEQQVVLADQANAAKSMFLANMSHELRTPLHGILSFAHFGIEKHASDSHAKLLKFFTQIKTSGNVLLRVLNDLLDLAKLESGQETYVLKEHDLHELIAPVLEEFVVELLERSIPVRCDLGIIKPVAMVDPQRIQQVVRNVLSNALKFSPDHTCIELATSVDDFRISIQIRDHGPGIPEDELDTIFDKFVQSTKTNSGAGGTGLGLAISHEIMALQSGHIWAKNHPEGGAVFMIELPSLVDPSDDESALVLMAAGAD